MTLIRTPNTRAAIPFEFVKNGDPVGAGEWSRAADTINYAASRGRVLVPAFSPDTILSTLDGATTWTFSLWLEPGYQALQQNITAQLHIDTTGTTGELPASRSVDAAIREPYYTELRTLAAQTSAGAARDVTIEIAGTSENGFGYVSAIQVVEVSRAFLETNINERGISTTPFVSGQPIAISRGVDALRDAVADDTQIGRRVLLHYAEPYKTSRANPSVEDGAGGDVITSATYVTVRGGAGSPVLARKQRVGDTTRVVKGRVFARCNGAGTTGEVRFVSSENGASSAVSFDGTVTTNFAWSNEVDVTVDCEDLATAQGLQGGAWDELSVEARRTAGAASMYVCGWVLYESD